MENIDDDVAQTFSEDGFNTDILDEFSIDLSLSNIERIERYIYSDIVMQRLVHVQLINTIIDSMDLTLIREHIIPILGIIANDEEVKICIELCKTLPGIVKAIFDDNQEESFALCREYLFPLLWNLHGNHTESTELNETIIDTVTSISKILPSEVNLELLITQCIEFLHSNSTSTIVFSLQLLGSLCSFVDPSVVMEYIIPEISVLCSSVDLEILKLLPTTIVALISVPNTEAQNTLLTLFYRLIDSSLWIVRKCSAEKLPDLTKSLPKDHHAKLLNTCLTLYNDRSKWVRITAKHSLGYILSYIDPSLITSEVIEKYASLPSSSDETDFFEITQTCAYVFPGVLQTAGKEYWNTLKPCYEKLFQQPLQPIQLTLAASLGEVSGLAEGLIEPSFLMKQYTEYLNHTDSSIVTAGIRSSSQLFRSIDTPHQVVLCETLLSLSKKLQENTFNWRVQREIMIQLPKIIECASDSLLNCYLISLFAVGIHDMTDAVRREGMNCVTSLMKRGMELKNEQVLKEVVNNVQLLKDLPYQLRELMIQGIRLYLPFVKDNEEIMQSTKDIIKQCQEDKVINVQSEVSLLLSEFTDVLEN